MAKITVVEIHVFNKSGKQMKGQSVTKMKLELEHLLLRASLRLPGRPKVCYILIH